MHFDVIFLDTTSPKYYDRITLEKEALGGSEASVIRVAESLGKLGLKVAVIEARIKNYFEPTIGQYAFFFHSDDVESMSCKHYIQIRGNTNPQLFHGARKYVWLHDVCTDEAQWLPSLKEHRITVIGVSSWHESNIRKTLEGYDNITHIYNPVPDEIFVDKETILNYDPNVMVWASSPHKGLDKAITLFKEIKKKNHKMQLIVFNPGYKSIDVEALSVISGISVYGAMSCKQVWSVIQKSLCVFYPTEYEETMCLVAAEANALGTPVATNSIAALKEVVSSTLQFPDNNDLYQRDITSMVLDWSKNGRPKVLGKEEFKSSNVIMDWVRLLAR